MKLHVLVVIFGLATKFTLVMFYASIKVTLIMYSGLPHTQGIQENLGNFQVEENLRETQGTLIYF